jgi:plastocyanin
MQRTVTVLLALLAALPLAAATIDVQVTYPDGAPIRDAVVYAIPSKPVPVGHKVATMDQRDRTFMPHVLPVQTGTWIEFPNSDNIRHQVYSLSPAKRFQLPLYSGKPAFPLQFEKAGIVTLGCNIHEQMSAFIVVVDTPYFAKTEGAPAVLRDLAPGAYTLRVWYPGMREEPKAQPVTLRAEDHPALTFVATK